MLKERFRVLFLLFAVITILAFIPKGENPIDRLVAALQKWEQANPQEKVYLHTDRSTYSIGDTIWFKGYVTVGSRNHLSALNGALYVELVTAKDSVTEMLKLPITAGMVKGNFNLVKPLSEGSYRLRAYTQWMRNAGPSYFYDKVFHIMNPPGDAVFTNINYNFETNGTDTTLIAVLNYSDSLGKSLTFLPMKYNLRKNYNTLYKGEGITDDKGQVRISLSDFKINDISGTHFNTTIELEDFSVVSKSFPIKVLAASADFRFFPEGGEMLLGMPTRVAFKSVGTDGLGLEVKGLITDQNGKEVGHISANRFGMGVFNLTPQRGYQYKAKLTYPDGSVRSLHLPSATEYGYSLAVNYNAEVNTLEIRVGRRLPDPSPGGNVYLILQSGAEVLYSAAISMSKSTSEVKISSNNLPTGITQVTLFSPTGEPMNERIIFLTNDDKMDLNLNTDKKVYRPRELVELNLDAQSLNGDDVTANFSIAVVNEDGEPIEESSEHTILSQLLLCADINGYIEQPNYYFHNQNAQTISDLDVLMLTQGYRRFNWKHLMSNKPINAPYVPESIVTSVTGRLVNLWGAKVNYGKVYMMNNSIGLVLTETTDDKGRFKFDDLIITEGLRFSVVGRKKNNGKRLEVLIDKYPLQRLSLNVNLPDVLTDFRKVKHVKPTPISKEEEARIQRRLATGKLLKEVNIRARQLSTGINTIKGQISQSIIFDERDSGKTIFKALRERNIPGFKLVNRGPYFSAYINQDAMDIIVNDSIRSGDSVADVLRWDVEDVIKVDLVRSGDVVTPTLLIYTRSIYKRNPFDPLDPTSASKWTPEVVNIFPRGFNKVREFYVPRYDVLISGAKPDLRKTIYWNPSVALHGSSRKLRFYNADGKGSYRVVVEGISSEGQLGRTVVRYRVE